MAGHLTERELEALLAPYQNYLGGVLTHRKTGTHYVVLDFVLREDDMTVWFTYRPTLNRRIKFMRPISEFFDGRWL